MGLIKRAVQEGEIIVPYEPNITPADPDNPGTIGKSLNIGPSVSENLFDNTFKELCRHFRNKFTVSTWVKSSNSGAVIVNARIAGNASRFQLGGVTNNSTLRLQIRANDNTLQKDWRFTIVAGTWNHIAVAVQTGKSEQVRLYLNGVKLTSSITKTVDLTLSSRRNISITNILASSNLGGNFYSLAVWHDRALKDTEITAIYNNGNEVFNLRTNSNGYQSRKYLRHWFIPEANQTSDNAMGIDYGKAYKDGMNLMDEASNITIADDLVIDTPSGR